MWQLLKRKIKKTVIRCDHKWYEVGEDFLISGCSTSPESDKAYWIYCPKCKTEDLVRHEKWERIEKKQEIDKQYREVDKLEYQKKSSSPY